jgi:uncharacterized protein YbjT (DUF2867 family)
VTHASRTVLVAPADGTIGGALIRRLVDRPDVAVRAMVRDPARFRMEAPNLDVVPGELDDPAALLAPMADVSHVVLASPEDDRSQTREAAVIEAARGAGGPHVVVVADAPTQVGDVPDHPQARTLGRLRDAGLPWTLVSPSPVMETSLEPLAAQVPTGVVVGMSGDGRVGFVALDDVADVLAAIVTGEGHAGEDYRCTGPAALDLPTVVGVLATVVGHEVEYLDLPEERFAELLLEQGGYADRVALERQVLRRLRAWRDGRVDLVTDTVQRVLGRPAMTVAEWLASRRARFARPRSLTDRLTGVALLARHHGQQRGGSS